MKIFKLLLTIAVVSLGTMVTFQPNTAIAAERVTFSVPILGEFSLLVEDLEKYADSGEISPKLAFYTKFLDPKALQQFRQVLKTSLINDPVTVYRLTNTPLGEDIVTRLGTLVYTHPERNGLYAIRAALIAGTAEPEGLTLLNFFRHFPTQKIQLNTASAISLFKEMKHLFEYKKTTIQAIAKASEREIALSQNSSASNLKSFASLSQSGQYQTSHRKMIFEIDNPHPTAQGVDDSYELKAEIYSPIDLNQSAPLAIIDHGFGAKAADYQELARHLASYGYIVVLPEHKGSSDNDRKALLQGEVGVNINPVEFYSRPRDITYLLNELEKHPDFQPRINWSQIGIMGHSLGGTTALLVGGANLDWKKIQNVCQQDDFLFNVSIFLQCNAKKLPPGNYNFRDPRIKAVVALNSIGSVVLGQESMSKIKIPTLIVGGTQDFIAPFVDEQVYPFLWLKTTHKYLATVVGGGHVAQSYRSSLAEVEDVVSSSSLDQDYLKALSLAFFEAHIRDRPEYQSYLTADYAQKISNPELPLHLIRSLTWEQLKPTHDDLLPLSGDR